MNVKQFKDWLEQFDDDVIVEVGVQGHAPIYHSFGEVYEREFIGFNDYNYTSFVGNNLVSEDQSFYNKKYLFLGDIN